ncbi:MAG TPA: hypothetical protein VFB54_13985 [Burkholderiales bacterium]|nr:hypothetical protein [Burkholderiales bacterium]
MWWYSYGWWWWWLLFLLIFFVLPLGYGWGYRGWGPWYRRRVIDSRNVPAGPTPEPTEDWGWIAIFLWIILIIAIVWLIAALSWYGR